MGKYGLCNFIAAANNLHNNLYLYDNTVYKNAHTKVKIKCSVHGIFECTPSNHLHRKSGCPKCTKVYPYTKESFMIECIKVHGDIYDYADVKYVNMHTDIDVICTAHGKFKVSPSNHLHRKSGCPRCNVQVIDTQTFIDKAISLHGTLFNYDAVLYVNSNTKIIIRCNKHGTFKQLPNNHLYTNGCPTCARENNGFRRSNFRLQCESKNGTGTLYIIECVGHNEKFYKVGITSRTVSERFKDKAKMPYSISVIYKLESSADMIYNIEREIMRIIKNDRYIPSIKFGGYTECFSNMEKVEQYLNTDFINKNFRVSSI